MSECVYMCPSCLSTLLSISAHSGVPFRLSVRKEYSMRFPFCSSETRPDNAIKHLLLAVPQVPSPPHHLSYHQSPYLPFTAEEGAQRVGRRRGKTFPHVRRCPPNASHHDYRQKHHHHRHHHHHAHHYRVCLGEKNPSASTATSNFLPPLSHPPPHDIHCWICSGWKLT